MEQLPEHRINILLIADMLHCKVLKRRLQVLILTPEGLMRPTGDLDIAVVAHYRQYFFRQNLMTQR